MHGVEIDVIEGLDLTNDIDGAAALSAAMDLLVVSTAAAACAASVGTEVWFLTAGLTWPQLGTDDLPGTARPNSRRRNSAIETPLSPEGEAALAEFAAKKA